MTCRICGNAEGNREVTTEERMFGLGDTFTYFQCARCECLQIVKIPADMSRYYPPDYYSLRPREDEPLPVRLAKRLRNRWAVFGKGFLGRLIFRRVPNTFVRALRIPGIRTDWRILDVGSGAGQETRELGEIGFRDVTGVDPFIPEDITYRNGVRIRKGSVHDITGEWNVVVMHLSFEHVPDPLETLQSAARLLRKGGWMVVSIPVVPCWAWEHYGPCWVAMDPPRHLHIHSGKSMAILAEKAGLTLDHITFNSDDMQFWGSEQYQKGIPLFSERSYMCDRSERLWTKDQIKEFRRRAEELNTQGEGDNAVFYYRPLC